MSNVRFNLAADNKLLAEFMGWKLIESDSEFVEGWGYWEDVDGNHICDDGLLSFDSWDDLMEVVEKIESVGYSVVITGNICRIEHEGNGDFVICKTDNKIVSVYESCTSFVKWYNANVK